MSNTLSDTVSWFEKAVPSPDSKNFHTQLGVHFEEVGEMVASLKGTNRLTQSMLTNALVALHGLALHLKFANNVIDVPDEVEFLDSICDQIVTVSGVGHMRDLDVVGGLNEVNHSNFSKFFDGEPLFDVNRKIIKGPRYFKPDLTSMVPQIP